MASTKPAKAATTKPAAPKAAPKVELPLETQIRLRNSGVKGRKPLPDLPEGTLVSTSFVARLFKRQATDIRRVFIRGAHYHGIQKYSEGRGSPVSVEQSQYLYSQVKALWDAGYAFPRPMKPAIWHCTFDEMAALRAAALVDPEIDLSNMEASYESRKSA
jgi:hypothetical protein